jgi:mRNA interferase RelE/StbE
MEAHPCDRPRTVGISDCDISLVKIISDCKLPPDVRAEIEAKIERFAKTGAGNVKRLTGRPGARLRVGDWRVIFVEATTTLEIRAVGNRRDIYK